jgi:hypothetical protein
MPGPKLPSTFVALGACLLLIGFGPGTSTASAAPTEMVDVGTASTYGGLSGASVANTVSAAPPHTRIRGDLGVKVNAPPSGFPPGIVTGETNVGNSAAIQAHADLLAAYNEVEARLGAVQLPLTLAGQTLVPGLYKVPGAASNTGTVTLDAQGDPNAVFVIQVTGALSFASLSRVVLTGGAKPTRVFWQVNGAADVGASGEFAGTVMALNAVAMGNEVLVNGRLFAVNGALTLDANQIYSAPPALAIDGGANALTATSTPAISGTTDLEAPGEVTVTVDGQTLTATPSGGAWSVSSASLSNGTYPVVASVTDAVGNQSSFTQQLTVDTVLPVVSIDGGPFLITNDPDLTISGTSDVDPGTIVEVSVDSQTPLSAVVQSDNTWNVTPFGLEEGVHTVTASVSDPAGNEGTDSQELTVDSSDPNVSITGGANALTNDPTPSISGFADVEPGSFVDVSVAGQTLSGEVQSDGTWAVTAAALSDGSYSVFAQVEDEAGNFGGDAQTLTVDTAPPVITITGGAAVSTSDATPTIAGTSTAAPGTIVTVSIAGQAPGQTLTTLLQNDGTWNTTSNPLDEGTWTVTASAPDSAGNVGSAQQTLVISPEDPPVDPPPPLPSGDPVLAAGDATVSGNASQRVRGSALSIRATVTASAKSGVGVTAGGAVRIRGTKKPVRLATSIIRVGAGQSGLLRLEAKGSRAAGARAVRQIKAAIANRHRVLAVIAIRLVDDVGNSRLVTKRVLLTR